MAINNPTVTPALRQIRARAVCDGRPLPGLCGFSWTESTHYTPATFSAIFATNADKAFSAQWWDARDTGMTIDLWVGVELPGAALVWTQIGTGAVDTHSFSAAMTRVEAQGRDLAALMIDQRTSETFQNRSASEIVAEIAARHALTGDVTPTTTPVGRYWGDHTCQTRAQDSSETTEWDLLVRIAEMEGFDLYMQGRTLHFHPAIDPESPPWVARFHPADSVQVTPVGNVHDLRMTRRFALAKPVTVVVRSFDSRSGKTVSASASFGAATRDTSIGGAHGTVRLRPTRYTYVRANLTQDQCQTMADRLLNDVVRHERAVGFSAPGDTRLDPRRMVRLDGTGTDFDQLYYIDSITKNVSFDTGFSMDVMAKNHSPSSDDATSE